MLHVNPSTLSGDILLQDVPAELVINIYQAYSLCIISVDVKNVGCRIRIDIDGGQCNWFIDIQNSTEAYCLNGNVAVN